MHNFVADTVFLSTYGVARRMMDIAITMFVTHKSIDIITLAQKAEALDFESLCRLSIPYIVCIPQHRSQARRMAACQTFISSLSIHLWRLAPPLPEAGALEALAQLADRVQPSA